MLCFVFVGLGFIVVVSVGVFVVIGFMFFKELVEVVLLDLSFGLEVVED